MFAGNLRTDLPPAAATLSNRKTGFSGTPILVKDAFLNGQTDLNELWIGAKLAFDDGRPTNVKALIAATASVILTPAHNERLKKLNIIDAVRKIILASSNPLDAARDLFGNVALADRQKFVDYLLQRETEFPWAADPVFVKTLIALGATAPESRIIRNIRKFAENATQENAASQAAKILALLASQKSPLKGLRA